MARVGVLELVWQVRRRPLVLEHDLQPRIRPVALRALGLKAHPEFETLDVAEVLAEGELLETVTLLVAAEANEAADQAKAVVALSVGDHAHLNEMLRVDALLQHIVNAVLAQSLHCRLVLVDFLLDVGHRVLVDVVRHLLVVVHPS